MLACPLAKGLSIYSIVDFCSCGSSWACHINYLELIDDISHQSLIYRLLYENMIDDNNEGLSEKYGSQKNTLFGAFIHFTQKTIYSSRPNLIFHLIEHSLNCGS